MRWREAIKGLLDAVERLNGIIDRLRAEVADLNTIAGLPLIESERAARKAESERDGVTARLNQAEEAAGTLAEALDNFERAFARMPDAGLTDNDPRWRWWHETAEARMAARERLDAYRRGVGR